MTRKVRPKPCTSCPYRQDVPSGIWDASEYNKLPIYDGDTTEQAMKGALSVFLCHQADGHVCAGWAGCHDTANLLALRIPGNDVDLSVFGYVSPVPLFASGAEAAEHGKREIRNPGDEAKAKVGHLLKVRDRRSPG